MRDQDFPKALVYTSESIDRGLRNLLPEGVDVKETSDPALFQEAVVGVLASKKGRPECKIGSAEQTVLRSMADHINSGYC